MRLGVCRVLVRTVIASVVFAAAGQAADTPNPDVARALTDIQQMIQGSSHVYTLLIHNANTNQDGIDTLDEEFTNMHIDPAACRLGFHYRLTVNGQVNSDGNSWVLFNTIESVHILQLAESYNEGNAQGGHPELTVLSDQPLVRVIFMHRSFGAADLHVGRVSFASDADAIHFSNAVMGIAKLCGASPKFSMTLSKKQIASPAQIAAARMQEQQRTAAQQQVQQPSPAQQAQQEDDDRQAKINDLEGDIEEADNDADGYQTMAQSAAEETNTTCYAGGLAGSLCRQGEQEAIDGYVQQANEARQKADRLRRQLAELQNAPPPPPSAQAQAPQVGAAPAAPMPNLIQNAANQQTAAILAIGRRGAPAPVQTFVPPQVQQTAQPQPSANYSTASNDTGNRSSGGNIRATDPDQYTAPLNSSCVSSFWDQKYYGWLSFQNNCGQSIHLGLIAQNGAGVFGGSGGSVDIAAGGSANIGQSQSEVNAAGGGYILMVCPAGYIAVAANGGNLSASDARFQCKKL